MKKRTRTILFASFVGLFFLSLFPLVFYTKGYRIDFDTMQIRKTGGIFLGIRPYPADVFVDGKLREATNFLFRDVFVSNLLPKTHKVEVRKDGYHAWRKDILVKAEAVSEASYIRLYPLEPRSIVRGQNVQSFFSANEGEAAVFETKMDTDDAVAVWLYTTKNNQQTKIAALRKNDQIIHVVWSLDDEKVLIVLKNKNVLRLLAVERNSQAPQKPPAEQTQQSPETTNSAKNDLRVTPINISAASSIVSQIRQENTRFQWSKDGSAIYMLLPRQVAVGKKQQEVFKNLYRINLAQKSTKGPLLGEIVDFLTLKDGIYVIEGKDGFLMRYTDDLSSSVRISSRPYGLNGSPPKLLFSESFFFLLRDGELSFFDSDTNEFVLIDIGVRSVLSSPNREKIVILKEYETLIYWLKKINRQPEHKQGEIELILRFSSPITDVSWISAPFQYLTVSTKNALNIVELDSRGQRNIVEYQQFASQSTLGWNQNDKSLFLISNSGDLTEVFPEQGASPPDS